MKKLISIIALCACAVGVYAQATKIKQDGEGLKIGGTGDKIGFFGGTPAVKGTGVTAGSAVVTLTKYSDTITFIAPDGSTNTATVLTNVTVNAVAGATSTNQINGIISTLRNLGLAGN